MTQDPIIFSDPVLCSLHKKIVSTFGEIPPITAAEPQNYFKQLCASIISQQLSTKVADVIKARVTKAIQGLWEPKHLLSTEHEKLREAGLSNNKVKYIKNIAEAWATNQIIPDELALETDEAVIMQLSSIKGVGRWTAEMFLIFTLGRQDVFSAGDYGLRKAISKHYNFDITEKPATFIALAGNWQPHRSLASRILWKSLELSK